MLRLGCVALALLALPAFAPAAEMASLPALGPARADPNLVLLEVTLQGDVLTDSLSGYQIGNDVFLPLGELSRLLTLAIRTAPTQGRADGYILKEEREFHLDVIERTVYTEGSTENLDRAAVKLQADDIYVASKVLARWLPADFALDMSALSLTVKPRETLPLQSNRQRRERARNGVVGPRTDPGYPRQPVSYSAISTPFLDQTMRLDAQGGSGRRRVNAGYTVYATADLLGLEASLFAAIGNTHAQDQARLTLGRSDPDARLLGPLQARSAQFGSIAVPGVSNVLSSSPAGNGVLVSNRPLNVPTNFDSHLLQGDLPPGWDVELFVNDALLGFQQSRADGRYTFEVPLVYGVNEFRLVFHGPLGQLRVERQTMVVDRPAVRGGQLEYSVARQRDDKHRERTLAQFTYGLTDRLTATAGMVELPLGARAQRYTNAALRGYWNSFILSAEAVKSSDGGKLAQVGVNTSVAGMSLLANHAQLDHFSSDWYLPTGDPVKTRDELRLNGRAHLPLLPVLPLQLDLRSDLLESGRRVREGGIRVSGYLAGSAITNSLRWQSSGGAPTTGTGMLQVSRRVAGVGLSGQLDYETRPDARLSNLAISADKDLAEGMILNVSATHAFRAPSHTVSASLNKTLGSYGLGVTVNYASNGAYSAGMQLFMAMGAEPRQSRWLTDAQPMAGTGAASVLVYLDRNMNGVMDEGDQPIRNAGFLINGGADIARTNGDGIAWLSRLPSRQNVDIALDNQTLEDPAWTALRKGLRVVPRPGKVAQLEFAVNATGELDGTIYRYEHGLKRPAAGLRLELMGIEHKVLATATTGADGYFVVSGVLPGDYLLRLAPDQLKELKLTDTGMHLITMQPDGDFLYGKDLLVVPGDE